MQAVKEYGVKLTPVDSEHSAIFQALQGNQHKEVNKLIITASGGPFRNKTKEELEQVTLAQCLQHPNWSMGRKVTVDSATLANKGLEIMEAHWLFDIPYDRIEPVVHPQSIVHSLVEYCDGSVMAQLGIPDMRLPIQYALSHPTRWNSSFGQLDLLKIGHLDFMEPRMDVFPTLQLAIASGTTGGTMPCAFNAANEIVVENFLQEKIRFVDIPKYIELSLEKIENITEPQLEDIAYIDKTMREITKSLL